MMAMIPMWVVDKVHAILSAINFNGTPPPPFH